MSVCRCTSAMQHDIRVHVRAWAKTRGLCAKVATIESPYHGVHVVVSCPTFTGATHTHNGDLWAYLGTRAPDATARISRMYLLSETVGSRYLRQQIAQEAAEA